MPAGELIKVVNSLVDHKELSFTNGHLYVLAEDLVNRLKK